MKMVEFKELIKKVNEKLDDYKGQAVQRVDKRSKKDQQTNPNKYVKGRVFFGYKPQYLFDAVNEYLTFSHEVQENYPQSMTVKTSYGESSIAKARVKVHFHDDEGKIFFSTGYHTGSSNVMNGEEGDAEKGAITDGIQKAMSLVGIGSRAYRGELQEVYSTPPQGGEEDKSANNNTTSPPKTTSFSKFKNKKEEKTKEGGFKPKPSFKKFSEANK